MLRRLGQVSRGERGTGGAGARRQESPAQPQERGGDNDGTETMPRISPYMGTQAGARGQI